MRVAASSASMIAAFSRRKRATSASWRLSVCTSGAMLSASSATAVSDPLRRRFSRAACLTSRPKPRAAR